jgi:hypothetical protein
VSIPLGMNLHERTPASVRCSFPENLPLNQRQTNPESSTFRKLLP